jgi:hypothetical protein
VSIKNSVYLWLKIPKIKKTGLGAEGEEKAILPSPVDCAAYFYLYHPNLSSEKTDFCRLFFALISTASYTGSSKATYRRKA